MNNLSIPPITPVALTPPHILAQRLKILVGQSYKLTGKTRTDGSNIRKLVAKTLLEFPLPEAANAEDYSILTPPNSKKAKGVPKILLEYIDTYIITTGTSYNLQVWNRNPASKSVQIEYTSGATLSADQVRFVFVRVDPVNHVISSVVVLTPDYIESTFGAFGKPTIKHQLIIPPKIRQEIISKEPPILFYPDNPSMEPFLTNEISSIGGYFQADPQSGQLVSLETLYLLAKQMIGEKIKSLATKNRGQFLEFLIAKTLGYEISENDLLAGGYPDIHNQLLEVKVQDSPTVDLGRYSPQFEEIIYGPMQATTLDVRYLIALMDTSTERINGIILSPGSKLGDHFSYVADSSYKSQRAIPMEFFDRYKGQSVFNPQ